MVMHTLSSEFTLLRVINGETVAANCSGVTNGFVKPKLGKTFFTCTGASVDMSVKPPFGSLITYACPDSIFHPSFIYFSLSPSLSVPRPIIHPLSSPSNMFCVTSLDPDTLPSVATLLMDVMFYSGG